MAYPQVQATAQVLEGADVTSHDIPVGSLGTISAGDILLCAMAIDGNPTITFPSGYTSLVNAQDSSGTNFKLVIFFKQAVGGETNTTLTTSATEKSVGRIWRISGADPATNPAVATAVTGASINPDPPSLDPSGWGAEDTLWMPMVACTNGTTTFSAYPSSHTNGTGEQSGGTSDGVIFGSARRELNATSNDPSAFTIDTSRSYVASQVAIRPTQAVTSPLVVSVAADGDDEYWDASSPTYPVVTTPIRPTNDILQAGRSREGGPSYKARVALMRFDTSALPDNAYITAANLGIDFSLASNADDLAIVADAHTWTGVAADWTNDVPTPSATRMVSPLFRTVAAGGTQSIGIDDTSFINKSGYTYLRLMISKLPGDGPPTGQNYVNIANREHATLPPPRLEIHFTTTTPSFATKRRELFYHVQPPLASPKASRAIAYEIRTLSQAARVVAYQQMGIASAQRALTYDVNIDFTRASATRGLLYNLSSHANSFRELSFSVRAQNALVSRTTSYNVFGRAGALRGLIYNLIGNAKSSRALLYHLRAYASSGRVLVYNMAGIPETIVPVEPSSPWRFETEAEIERAMLNGTLGQIEFRYRMFKSDNLCTPIRELELVESASFSLDNFRDHTWELSLPLDYIDYFDIWSDWVRLEVEMRAGGYTLQRPFGNYFFMERGGTDAPQRRSWQLTGRSAEARLMGSTAHSGYSAQAGTGCLANVRSILLAQGVPPSMIMLPPAEQDVMLGTTLFFDPFQNSTDTRWLRICNLILAAGAFVALFADNHGRLNTRKVNSSNMIEATHTYGTNGSSDRMIVSETIPWKLDDENFANRVVVYSGDPAEAASYAVAENHDPNSRVSYERLGYWKQADPIELPALVTEAEAQMVALQALRAASGVNMTRTFETNFDTRVKPRQAYGLEVFDDYGDAIVSGDVWTVLTVQASLDLSPMHHEVMQGVSL